MYKMESTAALKEKGILTPTYTQMNPEDKIRKIGLRCNFPRLHICYERLVPT